MKGSISVLCLVSSAAFGPPVSAAIEGAPTATAGFVGMAAKGDLDAPTSIESLRQFEDLFGGFDGSLPNPFLAPSVAAFFANGGLRCFVVRVAEDADEAYIGAVDPAGPGTGLEALRKVGEVSSIAVPGTASPRVQSAMIAQCEELGDRFAVLDSAEGDDLDAVLLRRQGLRSDHGFAALYFPWVRVSPGDVRGAVLPPSGFVAGIFARTDREQGVWKAPVGEVLTALDVTAAIDDLDQETLNSSGICAIRRFAGRGVLVWGARTISSDPEWKYVNVRRFFIYLEESIQEGTEWAVFEPNDEPLWSRLRDSVYEFLIARWRDGALLGSTPDQACFVRVDRTTMTQDDIDQGRTVIQIGVAVLRPAEFTILRIAIQRPPAGAVFRRGDANADGGFDLSDPVAALDFLFRGAAEPACLEAADVNDSGVVDISDAVYGLRFLFLGGPPPAGPFDLCGPDPSADELGCGAPAACP